MRARAKIDDNQKEIVRKLRQCGFSVQSLATIGDGCPDILVGGVGKHGKFNVIIEIKDGSKVPSKRKLTPEEVRWHEEWRGQVNVCNNFDEAFALLNTYK